MDKLHGTVVSLRIVIPGIQGVFIMSKQTERTAQTKADLVDAFWKLYKEKPINKITVKEVTDTAGYYRSTMYYYFEDVYAILDYIEKSVMQDWEDSLTIALQNGQAIFLQNNIHTIINQITPFYARNGEYIAVLLSSNGDPLFQQKIKDTLRYRLFTMLDIPLHTIEAEIFFEGVSSGMLALFVKWYDEKLSLNLVTDVLQKFLDKNVLGILLSYSSNPLLRQLAN